MIFDSLEVLHDFLDTQGGNRTLTIDDFVDEVMSGASFSYFSEDEDNKISRIMYSGFLFNVETLGSSPDISLLIRILNYFEYNEDLTKGFIQLTMGNMNYKALKEMVTIPECSKIVDDLVEKSPDYKDLLEKMKMEDSV